MKNVSTHSKVAFLIALLLPFLGFNQTSFGIHLESVPTSNIGGIQSFAYGQHNGKWLIVGGRLDGLHRRQPWASFDQAGHNNQLIVIDPANMQQWTAPLSVLPNSIAEQLSSTNMNFHQEGDFLYCLGGYGYSATQNDHTTFPNLTAIDVPSVIDAVINGTSYTSFFRQITDNDFQVTGGRLKKVYDVYYLLGGQKFLGKYNPMGPNDGPGFVQEYTNSVRKFTLLDDGVNLTITHLPSHTDATLLHRRDYNAEPQILPNGEQAITMFSGVFQAAVNLPFLNSVTVDSNGYAEDANFQQYFNHYHCPVIPLYQESTQNMHTIFFGGIAQYYNNNGNLIQDDNVPFVKTIARVTRDANGVMTEYKLPVEMPTFLGAGAEFIPVENLAHFSNDVLKLDSLTQDTVLLGYIFGGIQSTQENIFFINDGTQSSASHQIFKVYFIKDGSSATDEINEQSNSIMQMRMYPNPTEGLVNFQVQLLQPSDVVLRVYDMQGKLLLQKEIKNLQTGKNTFTANLENFVKGGVYQVHLSSPHYALTQRLILAK